MKKLDEIQFITIPKNSVIKSKLIQSNELRQKLLPLSQNNKIEELLKSLPIDTMHKTQPFVMILYQFISEQNNQYASETKEKIEHMKKIYEYQTQTAETKEKIKNDWIEKTLNAFDIEKYNKDEHIKALAEIWSNINDQITETKTIPEINYIELINKMQNMSQTEINDIKSTDTTPQIIKDYIESIKNKQVEEIKIDDVNDSILENERAQYTQKLDTTPKSIEEQNINKKESTTSKILQFLFNILTLCTVLIYREIISQAITRKNMSVDIKQNTPQDSILQI